MELRIADNEAAFRAVNEAIEEGRRGREGLIAFVCECGRLGCNELVRLTIDEYEQVRAGPRRFVVADGHELPAAEDVVQRGERFTVVAKKGAAGERAEESDPRTPGDAGTP